MTATATPEWAVQLGLAGVSIHRVPGFGEIFGEFFGFGDAFGGGAAAPQPGSARRGFARRLSIEFEEAAFGTETRVMVRRHEACEDCRGFGNRAGKGPYGTCRSCAGRAGEVSAGFFQHCADLSGVPGDGQRDYRSLPKCKGEGRILRQRSVDAKIPAGVEDGTRIRFTGGGEAGPFGGPAGDLYVVLHVKEHPFFVREGNDLHCAVPLSVTQAAMGAEIRVPTLEGEHTLKIPEGTQPGTTFRIRNKGVPVLNGHGKGDLYVEVRVQIPSKLSKRQKELLQELETTAKVDNQPMMRSLLGRVKDMFG
jgi:molecular chaperone DnaJ